MADFFYSPEARRDLLEIWEFIAEDDLDTADRMSESLSGPPRCWLGVQNSATIGVI